MPAEPTRKRLERMLVLVPWVLAHPEGPTVEEVCARFGITREELQSDVETLLVCGLPPFSPGDYIEAWVEEDRVTIRQADWLSRPFRLTREEAVALLVTGRAIASLPGLDEDGTLASALGKLERAVAPEEAGAVAELAGRVQVEIEGAESELLSVLRAGVEERRTVRMTYLSAGTQRLSDREVDPLRVALIEGHWYLIAFDHESGEERLFRLERIKEAAPTGARFEARETDLTRYDDGFSFATSARDLDVTVELAPEAAWVAERAPCEREPLPGGGVRMRLRTERPGWLVRLLLMAAGGVRAVEPPELADALREAASATLALYGD